MRKFNFSPLDWRLTRCVCDRSVCQTTHPIAQRPPSLWRRHRLYIKRLLTLVLCIRNLANFSTKQWSNATVDACVYDCSHYYLCNASFIFRGSLRWSSLLSGQMREPRMLRRATGATHVFYILTPPPLSWPNSFGNDCLRCTAGCSLSWANPHTLF